MTLIKLKLLINRFDGDPDTTESESSCTTSIIELKERFFEEDLKKGHNIRLIHRGNILRDDAVLERLGGYQEGELLVLTVFVTKPDSNQPTLRTASKGTLWKWSTSAWIMVVATLWCYKFKIADSFRRFPVIVLYVITLLSLQMIFTRVIGSVESR